jgi:membrane associated rhomboid family serine protease
VEAQTDVQTYLEQGKQALAQGHGRDAAIAYAHAAQIEPENPMVHLGLAEANLALGNYGIVQIACRRVQELQPRGGVEGLTAQALLDLLDRRYERALEFIDKAIAMEPGVAYMHALRSYLLRAMEQDYDANLARARAARLSYGSHFENCFPPLEARYSSGYQARSMPPLNSTVNGGSTGATAAPDSGLEPKLEHNGPTWSPPNQIQRQIIRTRFAMSRYANLVTYLLIGINTLIYVIMAFMSHSITISLQTLVNMGAQVNVLVAQGQVWRIFTAMFLHFDIFHIGLNMLSLFFIGTVVEIVYGKWRYLLIYLGSGIIGGIVTYFLMPPDTIAAGASGAIFGVFGALGVFYLINRRAVGGGAIGNWLFWLGLNIVFDLSNPSIGLLDHLGGLIAGVVLAFLLMPRLGRRRM